MSEKTLKLPPIPRRQKYIFRLNRKNHENKVSNPEKLLTQPEILVFQPENQQKSKIFVVPKISKKFLSISGIFLQRFIKSKVLEKVMEKVDHSRTSETVQDMLRLNQLTRAERINAVASAIIAFITILGLMIGLYFNLKTSKVNFSTIFIFELILIIMVLFILGWLWRYINKVK